jgi:hypothetical protein
LLPTERLRAGEAAGRLRIEYEPPMPPLVKIRPGSNFPQSIRSHWRLLMPKAC